MKARFIIVHFAESQFLTKCIKAIKSKVSSPINFAKCSPRISKDTRTLCLCWMMIICQWTNTMDLVIHGIGDHQEWFPLSSSAAHFCSIDQTNKCIYSASLIIFNCKHNSRVWTRDLWKQLDNKWIMCWKLIIDFTIHYNVLYFMLYICLIHVVLQRLLLSPG